MFPSLLRQQLGIPSERNTVLTHRNGPQRGVVSTSMLAGKASADVLYQTFDYE
jgi:carbamate kinase